MTNRPLPEAIRGCWFFIPDANPQSQSGQKNSSMMHFNLDGSFERFQIKDNTRKPMEQGTYTFDGMFLILRGRNTDTYRVHPESYFRWNIEGKKDGQALVRGYPSHVSTAELTTADQKDIRSLPMRVSILDEYTHVNSSKISDGSSNGIYQLIYQTPDQIDENIANFFVESHPDNRIWVGLSPFVKNIPQETWQQIINDCLLDIYLNKPVDINFVTICLLDSDESFSFSYQTT